MRMRETYIDSIDNVSRIKGFVSYEDYLNMPAVRELAEERGITLPTIKKRPVEAEVAAAESAQGEKKSGKKAAAIIGAILSAVFIAWCAAAVFLEWKIGSVAILSGGLWKTQAASLGLLIGACALAAIVGVIVRLATLNKAKATVFVAGVMATVLGMTIGIGLYGAITKGTVQVDVAVAIVLAALNAGVSLAAMENTKKEKKTEQE